MNNKKSLAQKIFDSLTSRPFTEDRVADKDECLKRIDKVLNDHFHIEYKRLQEYLVSIWGTRIE